jgi:hypothetical protein
VVVQCPDHLLAGGPTSLEVADKDIANIQWEVDAGLRLTVHVVDEVERPVPGARFVMVWPPPPQGGARPVMPLSADADGRYQVPSVLRPGTYRFEPAAGSDGQLKCSDGSSQAGSIKREQHHERQPRVLLPVLRERAVWHEPDHLELSPASATLDASSAGHPARWGCPHLDARRKEIRP